MKRIKLWWLSLWCPKFWEHFPTEDKAGPWVAVALSVTFFSRRERARHLVNGGLKEAYIQARRLALNLDNKVLSEEIGIEWEVRRPFPDETYDNVPLTK